MKRAADPVKVITAGDVMLRVVALALAGFHGSYGFLLTVYGEALWGLPTYDAAKAMPGGTNTWAVIAYTSCIILLLGTIRRSERVVAVGAAISALWLSFFATAFGIDAIDDPTPVALPGVAIYGSVTFIAAARLGTAIGRR